MGKYKKIIFISIILIVLIISFVFIMDNQKKKNIEKQKNAVISFFNLINEEKYEEMYENLSSKSKEKISQEDFVKRNKNIYSGIDVTNVNIDITDIQDSDNGKILFYNERFYTSAGEVSFENSATIEKEDGVYKIDWNSELIFPGLKDDYKVRISTLKSKRGSIKDRNGNLLAYDGKISSVGIVPGKLGENKEENIAKISELLEISEEKINKELSASYVKDDTFVALKKISKESELKDKLLQIPGIMISNADGRVYNLGEEAAHLIGYVQSINAEELEKNEGKGYTSKSIIGKSGLELAYEDTLKGIDGSEIYMTDKDGERVKQIIKQEKHDGEDITLTIDSDVQKSFYNQMKDDKGFFVVMKPETGEILALVSTPTYNSNDFVLGMSNDKWNALNNDQNKPLYNRFRQTYCPGSTFKPITAGIGLTENVIDSNTEFAYTGTSWQKDKSWGDYFVTTLTAYSEPKNVVNALIRSDNIFFSQLSLKIGKDKIIDNLNKLGFNESIDFPIGLKKSQYLNEGKEFTDVKLASTGYGQGDVLVNPIHMASIYSAFVNEGNMIKPYIEYNDGKKEIFKENAFSNDATEVVKNALLKVVESPNGTANDMKIGGISIIGKTGTAELKKSKDDSESGTLGWFNCITLNRPEGNLLVVGMVENVQNNSSGGSHYVISKIKSVLMENK